MNVTPGTVVRFPHPCDSFVLSAKKGETVTIQPPVHGIIVYKGNFELMASGEHKIAPLPAHFDPYNRLTVVGAEDYNEAIVLERTPPFVADGDQRKRESLVTETRPRKAPTQVQQRLNSELWKAMMAKAKKDLVGAVITVDPGNGSIEAIIHDVRCTARGTVTLTVKEFPWGPEMKAGEWVAKHYPAYSRYNKEDKRWWFNATVKRTLKTTLESIIPWDVKVFSDENAVRLYLNTRFDHL